MNNKNITEDQLWAAYRLGHTAGIKKVQPVQYVTPVCPLHITVPLWTETQPRPDGSWLYCPFCRQNQFAEEAKHLKLTHHRQGYYTPHLPRRISLTALTDTWLNSDTSEEITVVRPIVGAKIERE